MQRVRRGDIALHTVTGRSIRRQKEFEPSRRWRETTKPKPQSKFRGVALTTEVTKCDPRRKLGAVFLTHRATAAAVVEVPHDLWFDCTASNSQGPIQCGWRPWHGEHHDPQTRRRGEDTPSHTAAGNGRSMEEEARLILREAVNRKTGPENLASAIRAQFAPLGDVELELPPREPAREPPRFD